MRRRTGGLAVLLTVGACVAVPSPARADNNHNGNGSGNRNAFSIRSPTHNHGRLITSNANAGGLSSIRNAFCKHQRICTIRQIG
jgi:hypothetical protein